MMRRAIPLILLTMAACSHASREAPRVAAAPPPVPAAAPAAVAPVAPPAPAPRSCQADGECAGGELCLAARCVQIDGTTAACDWLSIHFDFDQAAIRAEDTTVLQRVARCLHARSATRLSVTGNCDERGTAGYNLALGHRRATAAQQYLIDLGVATSRIETVSYGEERPVCTEQTEACWASNRRDDLARAQ